MQFKWYMGFFIHLAYFIRQQLTYIEDVIIPLKNVAYWTKLWVNRIRFRLKWTRLFQTYFPCVINWTSGGWATVFMKIIFSDTAVKVNESQETFWARSQPFLYFCPGPECRIKWGKLRGRKILTLLPERDSLVVVKSGSVSSSFYII